MFCLSGGRDRLVWSNGGMMISRGKLKRNCRENCSGAISLQFSHEDILDRTWGPVVRSQQLIPKLKSSHESHSIRDNVYTDWEGTWRQCRLFRVSNKGVCCMFPWLGVSQCGRIGNPIESQCPAGHSVPRCCISLLQCSDVPFWICRLCHSIAHTNSGNFWTIHLCEYRQDCVTLSCVISNIVFYRHIVCELSVMGSINTIHV
jgi:hypothetical protein